MSLAVEIYFRSGIKELEILVMIVSELNCHLQPLVPFVDCDQTGQNGKI